MSAKVACSAFKLPYLLRRRSAPRQLRDTRIRYLLGRILWGRRKGTVHADQSGCYKFVVTRANTRHRSVAKYWNETYDPSPLSEAVRFQGDGMTRQKTPRLRTWSALGHIARAARGIRRAASCNGARMVEKSPLRQTRHLPRSDSRCSRFQDIPQRNVDKEHAAARVETKGSMNSPRPEQISRRKGERHLVLLSPGGGERGRGGGVT